MKGDLQRQILLSGREVLGWASTLRNPIDALLSDSVRPSFAAHRLICALAEMEELIAACKLLWPIEEAWCVRRWDETVQQVSAQFDTPLHELRSKLYERGREVAEEELPNAALASSPNARNLYAFFCQLRLTSLFQSASTDRMGGSGQLGGVVEQALEAVKGLVYHERRLLQLATEGLLSSHWLLSSARIAPENSIGARYQPIFQAVRLLRGESCMNWDEISNILSEAEIKNETKSQVKRILDSLRGHIEEFGFDRFKDLVSEGGANLPGIGEGDGVVVIPGSNGEASCTPVVLAIAQGRDLRRRHGLPRVMRLVRAHLIKCFEVAEVVILLSDNWDPSLMKENEWDFEEYRARRHFGKLLIPVVVVKRQLHAYTWP